MSADFPKRNTIFFITVFGAKRKEPPKAF
jgi:hypothetical protein